MVEDVFSYPGIGLATIDAINHRDYPVLQGIFLLLTVAVISQLRRRPGLLQARPAGDLVSEAIRLAQVPVPEPERRRRRASSAR